MGIIMISDSVIALPKGIGPSDMDSLVDNFHLFEPINFLMPFLANALGTLVGALSIGILFLLWGIQMANILPAPNWFNIADLGFAYIPMAYLGYRLAK